MTGKVKANLNISRITSHMRLELGLAFLAFAAIFFAPQILFAQANESDDSLFKIEFQNDVLVIPCPKGCTPQSRTRSCNPGGSVSVLAKVVSEMNATAAADLWYEYFPEKGTITETPAGLRWDLTGVLNGSYWLKVNVYKGFETIDILNKSVELVNCECTCAHVCAEIRIESDKKAVNQNEIILFRAVQRIRFSENTRLRWKVTNGAIVSGQGARILKVRAGNAAGGALKIELDFVQEAEACRRSPEISISINPIDETPEASIDEDPR